MCLPPLIEVAFHQNIKFQSADHKPAPREFPINRIPIFIEASSRDSIDTAVERLFSGRLPSRRPRRDAPRRRRLQKSNCILVCARSEVERSEVGGREAGRHGPPIWWTFLRYSYITIYTHPRLVFDIGSPGFTATVPARSPALCVHRKPRYIEVYIGLVLVRSVFDIWSKKDIGACRLIG